MVMKRKQMVYQFFCLAVIIMSTSMLIIHRYHSIARLTLPVNNPASWMDKVDERAPMCKTFYFHRAEWTLYQKALFDSTTETEPCTSLYRSTFAENLVNWVICRNKTIHNLGCTKNTRKCAQGFWFQHSFNDYDRCIESIILIIISWLGKCDLFL